MILEVELVGCGGMGGGDLVVVCGMVLGIYREWRGEEKGMMGDRGF
jgi:hypothetical protein